METLYIETLFKRDAAIFTISIRADIYNLKMLELETLINRYINFS